MLALTQNSGKSIVGDIVGRLNIAFQFANDGDEYNLPLAE
jgi:hypothetical protein